MINLIKKLSKKNIFFVCMILFYIEMFWGIGIITLLDHIEHLPYYEGFGQNIMPVEKLIEKFAWWDIMIKMSVDVTIEEIRFRVIPMILWIICIKWIWKASDTTQKRFLLSIMIISSIVFGVRHGNIYNILTQGVSGFIFFSIFLIGYFKMKKPIYGVLIGTVASTTYHIFVNGYMLYVVINYS